MEYQIVLDAAADIDPAVAEQANISFIPMEYSLGDEMRQYASMESREQLKAFYNGQRGGDLTRTSQISPFQYESYFEPYLKRGQSVLYLCLSGGLSSTVQSACMARDQLKTRYTDEAVIVLDTLSATGGIGVLVERAVRNRDAGMTIGENFLDLTEAVKHIQHWFLVQDLNYLKRGGRVGAAAAVIGTALNVKPILHIDTAGKLNVAGKVRGIRLAVQELMNRFDANYDPAAGDVIYVLDADEGETAGALLYELNKRVPEAVIRTRVLSPIIGAHTGPGMAAVCYMGK